MFLPRCRLFRRRILSKSIMSRRLISSKPEPRPSSSVILLSPANQVLLLHRVKTTSFSSAHVFPGGNLDALHDGAIPDVGSEQRHRDGRAYRMGAIRECFEETGILLAKRRGELVQLEREEMEGVRRRVHGGEVRFGEWLEEIGAEADIDGLLPFTRWITPVGAAKRFTTQMYIYTLPSPQTPIPDGGIEHTEATFAHPHEFLSRARAGDMILFPPQFYLLHKLAQFLRPGAAPEQGRRELLAFLGRVPTAATRDRTARIAWADKVISPRTLGKMGDGRVVLGLDEAGPELRDSDRGGDGAQVVVVRFTREGPREVEVRSREDVKGKL